MNQARFNDRLHVCIAWPILVLWLNRVPRKYDFILEKYIKTNGARFVEYGCWIARLNPDSSITSKVFLVVWHGALSWCNTTFSIWATKSGRFFLNACGKPSRTKQHTISLMWMISLIKLQTFNRIERAFMCDILKFNVMVCYVVYLQLPAIPATSCTVRR